MAALDNGTIAIIAISVALGVTFIVLFICLIVFCRLRLQDDTNIRKRVLMRQAVAPYAQNDMIKTTEYIEDEFPVPMPMSLPEPMPLPRREIYMEPQRPATPPPPPPPAQPEIIVHEVIHRYQPTQPTQPTLIISPPSAPPMPEPQRIVRRSSWCAPQENDEWVMIKKTKKKQRGRRSREDDSDSSDDSDDEVYTKKKKCRHAIYGHGLAHYDLAMPMRVAPMGVMGAQPMMATPMMVTPMMTAGAATFQPTYGVVPMM